MLDIYLEYAKGMGSSEKVIEWIKVVLKNKLQKENIDQDDVEHIIDYLCSDDAPERLLKMSVEEAKANAEKWTKTQQKKGSDIVETEDDLEVIFEFDDGYKIVKLLTENAYKKEGFFMRHCLGGMSVDDSRAIYSLRDEKTLPHATFELRKNDDEIVQIKGKGNGSIHPRYIEKVLKFLDLMGQKIRPHDMKNLGYFHIEKEFIEQAKKVKSPTEQIVEIKNEYYVI